MPVTSYNQPEICTIHVKSHFNASIQNIPMIGGPMNDAIPWKSKRIPKAFVNFSIPNKSTKITEVKLT